MDGNIINEIDKMPIEDQMAIHNHIGASIIDYVYAEDKILHQIFCAKIVKVADLFANDYNPNRMPSVEMQLLKQCIESYGYLFPTICTWVEEKRKYRIIDGYHRYEDFKKNNRTWISIIDLKIPYHNAVQLTVLMNRIKGMHQVEKMSDLVVQLEDLGLMDEEICENLGMEPEEYLRLKQQLGIAHSFKQHEYSKSWE